MVNLYLIEEKRLLQRKANLEEVVNRLVIQ
jgi:hypothetical protein